MTPDQIAKSGSEHAQQAALFAWCAMAEMRGWYAADDPQCYTVPGYAEERYGVSKAVPELEWFHAIANGGSRGDTGKSRAIQGGKMKAEGVKSGVWDTFLPVRKVTSAGLYIEMKVGKNKLSENQTKFGKFVLSQNFRTYVCYTWRDAANAIKNYLTIC